uniref:Translation initiation factor IF-2-like n=1 Tax=Tursiops truncatus TaxID=9739 RepID=A0A6J3RKY4_TURTR|nr:translation initiation factor IF-2-like [Tursiops truncatus]
MGARRGAVLKQRAVPRKTGCGDRDTEDTGWLGPGQGEVGTYEPAAGAEVQGCQDAAHRGSLRLGAALQGPGGTRRCSWSKAGQQRDGWSPLTLIAAPHAGRPRPLGILARELPPPTQPALMGSRAPPGGTPRALQGKGWPELTPPPETVAGSALVDRAEEGKGQREGGGREGAAGPYLPAPGSGQGPEAKPAGLHAPQSWEWAGAWGGGPGWVWVPVLLSRAWTHMHTPRWEGRAGPLLHRTGAETQPQTTKGPTRATPQVSGLHGPRGSGGTIRGPWASAWTRRGRSVGNTGPGRPTGRSRGCSCVFWGISPFTTGQTLYRQTRNRQGRWGRESACDASGTPGPAKWKLGCH